MKKILIVLWNILSIILLLSLKIISIIFMLPIYIIMLVLTFFSPITYFVSFLYTVFYIGFFITIIKIGGFSTDIIGAILTMGFFAIPLIICGSCCLFGAEAAAGLLGFLGSIIALPITALFIRKNKPATYVYEYNNTHNNITQDILS